MTEALGKFLLERGGAFGILALAAMIVCGVLWRENRRLTERHEARADKNAAINEAAAAEQRELLREVTGVLEAVQSGGGRRRRGTKAVGT